MDNGEAEHAQTKHLERVAWFGFSSEGWQYRKAGINLLATIVIYWNTAYPGEAVRQRKHAGLTVDPALLSHIFPPWVGSHPAHRRIPVAKTPITALAYDSAPLYLDVGGVDRCPLGHGRPYGSEGRPT